jgi:hypothetical protein
MSEDRKQRIEDRPAWALRAGGDGKTERWVFLSSEKGGSSRANGIEVPKRDIHEVFTSKPEDPGRSLHPLGSILQNLYGTLSRGQRLEKTEDRKTERSVFRLLPGAKRRKFICLLSSQISVF